MDATLETAPCGFIVFADDGTVLEINKTLADMLGYTRLTLLGWHFEKILPAGGRIFYQTHIFPLLKMHGMVEEIYLALRDAAGVDIPVLMNAVRAERGGRIVSQCVFVRMIQRHQYEDQLLQARRLAEEANSAKAKFLAMMSHDLRTPLTTITGNADLILHGGFGETPSEVKAAAEAIKDASRALMQMIGDILHFAELESGRVRVRREPVRLTDAVARAETLVRLKLIESKLSFTQERLEDDEAVTADPDKLMQILLNLLTNAIKFTPPGGSIAVSSEREGDRVRIVVSDTGIGIAEEDVQRIFSPFVQLSTSDSRSANVRGVGLGLAISRDLARAMDGEVTVASELGKGSTFAVELPRARRDD